VQDEQVDLLDAELGGALVEGVQGLVVAVVGDPDLGLDEDLGSIDAGGRDGLPDLAFVAVGGGGVDVPVADLERRFDCGGRLIRRALKDAESKGWHLDAVVERQGRDGHRWVSSCDWFGLAVQLARRSRTCWARLPGSAL
jgi:hypothetical protein